MPPEEPSNAVLAEKIDALDERIREDRQDEEQFHARLEGRFDTLAAIVATLQRAADVDRTRTEANLTAVSKRMDVHDGEHKDAESGSRYRTGAMIAAFTAIGTLATVAVAIAMH